MEELLEILEDINPDVDYENAEDLIDGGYLDSLRMVLLVARIADELGVVIPAENIVPENFNSAKKIYDLIRRCEEED